MASDLADIVMANNFTPIQQFYAGSTVFITGATGFVGKMLLEKLLRSCPDIEKVYVLVRTKKGKTSQTRVDELLQDVLFVHLKEHPKILAKVVAINGDCSQSGIGICDDDRMLLVNEVSVVFHAAATVRFNERIKLASIVNVKGTREILKVCKEMKNLKAVVHVSTAFSNCCVQLITEKFYPPPIDPKKLINLAENLDDELFHDITPNFLQQFPNTYTYTKAVAEHLVLQEGKGLPIAVFRPSIIISTYREPLKAWVDSLYGPAGLIMATACGVLRSLQCDRKTTANVVPGDMCVNALIAIPWETDDKFRGESEHEIRVYHFESSTERNINWEQYVNKTVQSGLRWPTMKAIRYYSVTLRKCPIMHFFAIVVFHFLPGLILDLGMMCVRRKPKWLRRFKDINRLMNALAYFTTREFKFETRRIQSLIRKMSIEDRKLFFCDLKQLDWDKYFEEYVLGMRVYLLKDPLSTLRIAKVKWNRLYWVDRLFKLLFCVLVVELTFLCASQFLHR